MVREQIADKQVRKERFSAIKDNYISSLPEEHEENMTLVHQYFNEIHKKAARNLVLDEKKRLDGRQLNEVRTITTEVNYLPSAHGSALFTRGETSRSPP